MLELSQELAHFTAQKPKNVVFIPNCIKTCFQSSPHSPIAVNPVITPNSRVVPPQLIITSNFNNERSAIVVSSPQLTAFKPLYDEPPPPYSFEPNTPQLCPPPYEELDQLPGAILPSSSIQFQPPAIPSKR